jgi:regulator of ribosome biosynthesis
LLSQAGEDPFERIEQERRKGTKARKQGGASAQDVPATIKLSTKLDPGKVRGQIAKGKAMKGDIANASHLAGVSTASMGKFDKQLKGERDGERKLPGLRNKHLPVDGGDGEGGMVSKVLGKVTRCAHSCQLPWLLLPWSAC